MTEMNTPSKWTIVGAAAVFAMAGASASAQDATTTTLTEASTTTTTTTSTRTRTSATSEMIKEAIERSHARTERLRATGKAESFGSEEPFAYDSTKTLSDLSTFQ
jgi:hypothetical protein